MKTRFLLLLVFLYSCDPAQHLARYTKRHPELIKKDTIYKDTIVVTKESSKDTAFYYNSKDTVYIRDGKLEVKYFYNSDSTVYIEGRCKPDTIKIRYPVYVSNIEVEKVLTWKQRIKLWLFDNWWWILAIISVVIFIFRKVINAYFKAATGL